MSYVIIYKYTNKQTYVRNSLKRHSLVELKLKYNYTLGTYEAFVYQKQYKTTNHN